MNHQTKRVARTPGTYKKQIGAAAIEYAIIAGLIAVAFMGTAKLTGQSITTLFETVNTELDGVTGGGDGSDGGGTP